MHCKSYSHLFSKKFQHICVSLDVNFNESLTNDLISFEQLGPSLFKTSFKDWIILIANCVGLAEMVHFNPSHLFALFAKPTIISFGAKGISEKITALEFNLFNPIIQKVDVWCGEKAKIENLDQHVHLLSLIGDYALSRYSLQYQHSSR